MATFGLKTSQASLLDPYQFSYPGGPIGTPSDELHFLQNTGGGNYLLPGTSQYLGKFQATGRILNGAINISQYVTVNMVSAHSWEISWNLTGSGFMLDGVLVKDGFLGRAGALYRFYGVSADEIVVGSGTVTFDNPIKSVLHITFFGSPGSQGVPRWLSNAATAGLDALSELITGLLYDI